MSCAIGLKTNDRIYMGADSIVIEGGTILTIKESKIFKRGDFLIGFCGTLRSLQLMKKANIRNLKSIHEFVEFTKELFKKEELIRKEEDENSISTGSEFIVSHKNRLYIVGNDLSVVEDSKNDFSAIGASYEYALGSMYTTRDYDLTPRERLIEALKCAVHFCPGNVAPPFKVYSI